MYVCIVFDLVVFAVKKRCPKQTLKNKLIIIISLLLLLLLLKNKTSVYVCM